MPFQTKTFLSVLASMVNRCRSITTKITDYTVGSVARTLIEAPAQEIDELYQQMLFGLLEAIQTSVYTSFNFPPLGAVSASGLIRVTVSVQSSSILISANTPFSLADGSKTYAATTDTVISAGASFADVPVDAQVNGIGGNIPALNTFNMGISIPGFVSATNLQPFVNGSDAETPSAQKVRFNAYIQTLSRGTIAALLYALTRLTFLTDSLGNVLERVASANVDEPYLDNPSEPPGLVVAYIHNGVGGTSQALVQQAANVLNGYVTAAGVSTPGYKAAGVVVQVFAAGEQPVPVIGMLTIGPTFDPASVVAQVTAALYTYIVNIPVGSPYLAAVANDLVMQVGGVWDWMPVTPSTFVAPGITVKLVPGQFQILGWLSVTANVTTLTTGVLA